MEFTTLDDSLVHDEHLFIYTHAIITPDFEDVLIFSGNKNSIYQHEEEILKFIQENRIGDLYACGHYRQYPTIWDKVDVRSSVKYIPKNIMKNITKAHHLAKNTAKKEYERLKNY